MVKIRPWTYPEIEQLCELMSEDRYSFGQIADMMGRTRDQVSSQWRRVACDMESKLARRNRANGF